MFTIQEVQEVLDYDPDTGLFTWCERPGLVGKAKTFNTKFSNQPALEYVNRHGYKQGSIQGVTAYAHKIAYLLKTGEWVVGIDHINGVKTDNRACNLRTADHSLNARNMPRRSDNTSGFTGVYWFKQRSKWQARLQVNGKQHHLGLFNTPEEANEARLAANETHGFSENHGR